MRRCEAYSTSEGVIELVVRQRDGMDAVKVVVELSLSDATQLSTDLIEAVRAFAQEGERV